MNSIRFIIISYCLLAGGLTKVDEFEPPLIGLNDSLKIPEGELSKVEDEALAGSVSASERLVSYYMFVKDDKTAMKHWEQIGAENGSSGLQYHVGLSLYETGDLENQARALFWIKKAAKGGIQQARFFLIDHHLQ